MLIRTAEFIRTDVRAKTITNWILFNALADEPVKYKGFFELSRTEEI